MNYKAIFFLTVIYGCGDAPSSGTLPESPATAKTDKKPAEEVPTEEVIQLEGHDSAKLVASIEALPHCQREDEGELAYVKDVAMFYVCQEQVWHGIDLKGEKGIDGKDGQNAIAKDGEDGKDGHDGEDGANGKDGKTIALESNVWVHPVKGTVWFVGRPIQSLLFSNTVPNIMSPNFICPEGSRSGTEVEYLDALAAGLWLKLSSYAPLFVRVGALTSRTESSPGLFTETYRIRAGNTAGYVTDLNSSSYSTANALCLVEIQ